MKKVKVKAGVLQEFIRQIMSESWAGDEAMPTVINEPPLEAEPAIIEPRTETQVADSDLPVDDDEWTPGNLVQLGMAMKQLAERVPDSQIAYLWPRLRRLVEKANENVDNQAYAPSLEQMETVETQQ